MQRITFGDRILVVLHPTELVALSAVSPPFAMMLRAPLECPSTDQRRLIDAAAGSGCVEFCCIGPHSEMLHDYIDGILEDRELFNVVTTWNTDEPLEDSLHYFVHLAGGRPPTIVAAIGDDADHELLPCLERTIGK